MITYLSSRVSSRFGQPAAEYGTLPPGAGLARIIERATPRLAEGAAWGRTALPSCDQRPWSRARPGRII
ncbi:MAG: hypothetical protein ACYDH5_00215 [Acidimicrobiales bacterium]